jgi:23S rRNA pseudouridine1911/1915/1917 synthase
MAIVKGAPKEPRGTIRSRLVEWKDGTVHSTKQRNKGEEAISHYEVHQALKAYSLVRVKLETGRKHQIRVHLSELGTPIVGDSFYNKTAKDEGLMLVAIRLCFDHPRTGKRLTFEVPLPQHMRGFLRDLESASRGTTSRE